VGQRQRQRPARGAQVFPLVVSMQRAGVGLFSKELEHVRGFGAAIDDVAQRDDGVVFGKPGFVDQFDELKETTVDIANYKGFGHRVIISIKESLIFKEFLDGSF
jgi:hypothetical protein